MGTTLHSMHSMHSMRAIADVLELPPNCLPMTGTNLGWPAEQPAQRARPPPAAWVPEETYQRPRPEQIDGRFAERGQRGWACYRGMG